MELEFKDRNEFRKWLNKNVETSPGIWIKFIKDKSKESITADEALNEALCFGWIDGQMKSEGDSSYIKYFAPRTKNSKWSEKNKKTVEKLRKEKLMTAYGEREIKKAVENGQWQKEQNKPDMNKLILDFKEIIRNDLSLLEEYEKKPMSLKKQYAGFYFDAKTDETRKKRLDKITAAIKENRKGMLF
ncbi:MAG: hypothetical protein JW927_20615 [Deltaproteobacteria bacterium]|nr:hypothetical protein [Deltaproteobacteria bacterium]